ncbi:MAG: PilZ domain-containing protein [Novosphingobium sp.]
MTNTIHRPEQSETEPRPLRRAIARSPVDVSVIVTRGDGSRIAGRLTDVSLHGCNIQTTAASLRLGVFIAIALDIERPVQAIVRWTRGDSAGVEFLRPIPADLRLWHALIDSPWCA